MRQTVITTRSGSMLPQITRLARSEWRTRTNTGIYRDRATARRLGTRGITKPASGRQPEGRKAKYLHGTALRRTVTPGGLSRLRRRPGPASLAFPNSALTALALA